MSVNLRNELQSLADVQPTRDLWADALARVGSADRFRRPRRRLSRATQARHSSTLRRPPTILLAAAIVAVASGVSIPVLLATGALSNPHSPPAVTGPLSAGKAYPPTLIPPSAAGVAQANTLLPFDVVLPSDFENTVTQYPTRLGVYVSGQQLVGSFQSPSGATYDLAEGTSDETLAELEEFAQTWTAGHAEIQVIDGVHVLIQAHFDGQYRTTVSWLRGDGASPVLTFLQGPKTEGQSFTQEEALSIAADMISQGG